MAILRNDAYNRFYIALRYKRMGVKNTEKTNKKKTKIFISFLGVLLIGILVGAYIGYGATPTTVFNIESGNYAGAVSFTFFEDESGNFFAKNALGAISYSGSNSSGVMASAVASLTSGGAILILGDITFPNAIHVDDRSIRFTGETTGDLNKGGTILRFADDVNGFYINSDNVSYTPSVIIEKMLIQGHASYSGTAIKSAGQYLTVRDVVIDSFGVGISLEMANGVSAGDSLIENTVVRDCQYQGILIYSNDNRMSNVITHGNEDGIQLAGAGGVHAHNIHTWGNSANGLKISESVYDLFTNFQAEGNAGWGVYIGSLTGNVTSTKFMNSWIWINTNAHASALGGVYVGDSTYYINNFQFIGGQIGDSVYGANFTKGNNVTDPFIRVADLTYATISGWTNGTGNDIDLSLNYP